MTNASKPFALQWFLVLAPITWLWFRLIDDLRFDWSTNPQYNYGWIVPFLCLGLLMRRWQTLPSTGIEKPSTGSNRLIFGLVALIALLYLPTRLIEAATPEWTAIQWSLGIEAVALTLCAIYLTCGEAKCWQLAFPVCFFFVAIPWPTFIENRVIQSLTRVNSAMAIELLDWFNVPAMQHGNLIEVTTGTVGVDEACSGIRSFQTTLMISLFFGEFYRMNLARRLWLLPAGFVLAMSFNVIRMSILTWIAAKHGIAAISKYHDPTGVTIAVLCTAGLWLLALMFQKKQKVKNGKLNAEPTSPISGFQLSKSQNIALPLALIVWLVAVEVGVETWYHIRESHLKFTPNWSVAFPIDNPTFKPVPIYESVAQTLGFDEGHQAAWEETDGSRWSAFYATWFPGKVAGYLAKRHTPEICMAAGGRTLVSGPILEFRNIHGAILPTKNYVFQTDAGPLHVIHCRWEGGADTGDYVESEGSRFNLIRAIWAGRGNYGQKVLEIVLSGYSDPVQAKAAMTRELEKLVVAEKLQANTQHPAEAMNAGVGKNQ